MTSETYVYTATFYTAPRIEKLLLVRRTAKTVTVREWGQQRGANGEWVKVWGRERRHIADEYHDTPEAARAAALERVRAQVEGARLTLEAYEGRLAEWEAFEVAS